MLDQNKMYLLCPFIQYKNKFVLKISQFRVDRLFLLCEFE